MIVGRLIVLIAKYGLFGIFASMLIENIGIPLPTEGAFLVALNMVAHGRYTFWEMYWFIVASHMIGALVAYGLGRWAENGLMHRFQQSQKFVDAQLAIQGWYKKYGSITVLATRLIGYVRPWSSLVAGLAKFDFWPFLGWSFVGTLLFVYPTMKVSALLVIVWQRSPAAHLLISLSILLSLSIVFILARFLKPKSKSV